MNTVIQTAPDNAATMGTAAAKSLAPGTVLVPAINLAVATDTLQLAGMFAAGSPFALSNQEHEAIQPRVVVLGVVEVPADQPLSTGLDLARSYRALLDFLPSQVEVGSRQVRVEHLVKVARDIPSAVQAAVAEEHAGLVLFHWKGYAREPKRYTYGRILDAILRQPPCNVLLVRPEGWRDASRVLLPVRGGPSAEQALDLALIMSERLHLPLTVLHNVQPAPKSDAPSEVTPPPAESLDEEPYVVFGEYLEAMRSLSSVSITVVQTAGSDAAATLLEKAQEQDLVIMGMAVPSSQPEKDAEANIPGPKSTVANLKSQFESLKSKVQRSKPDETQNHALERSEGSKLKAQNAVPLPLVVAQKKGPPLMVLRTAAPLDLHSYVRKRTRPARKGWSDLPFEQWFVENTYHGDEFRDGDEFMRLKRESGLTISVALLTSNDARHIYSILTGLRRVLNEMHPIADQIAVIDAGSTDGTVDIARSLGVEVYTSDGILPEQGHLYGRGESWWKSLAVLRGDITVWLDPRAQRFHPTTAMSLAGPLLRVPSLHFVKAFAPSRYEANGGKHRPELDLTTAKEEHLAHDINWGSSMLPKRDQAGLPGSKVRVQALKPEDLMALDVTQVAALPPQTIMQVFCPPLAGVMAPFSRDMAGRRAAMLSVPVLTGENPDIGILLSVAAEYGTRSLAQVELQHARPVPPPPPGRRSAIEILQVLTLRLQDTHMRQCAASLAERLQREVEGPGSIAPDDPPAFEVRALGPLERPPMRTVLNAAADVSA
ncbi:MAG TPA: universal stress protein [Chloroflexia bacterium]|nr:universal stress protein [Chloroflexia bacterium]